MLFLGAFVYVYTVQRTDARLKNNFAQQKPINADCMMISNDSCSGLKWPNTWSNSHNQNQRERVETWTAQKLNGANQEIIFFQYP